MLNERIQEWLNLTGITRQQFADTLHVSKRTVEGWLGNKPRPIPAKLHSTIEKLMTPPAEPGCIPLQLFFSDEKWKKLTAHIPDGPDKKAILANQIMALLDAIQLPK